MLWECIKRQFAAPTFFAQKMGKKIKQFLKSTAATMCTQSKEPVIHSYCYFFLPWFPAKAVSSQPITSFIC